MLFNSLAYIFFLSITAIAYYIFPARFHWIWLLIASVGYYLSFIPIFLPLIVGIVIINFFLAKWMAGMQTARIKPIFIIIILVNIIILAFFKYFNFFFPGNQVHLYYVDFFFRTEPINKMILPLGLSYLTFTVLKYQIEIKVYHIQYWFK